MLKDQPIAVTPNNGSHFTTLKMMEGFCAPEHIKTTGAGSMPKRLEALREGKVAAVSLMEPWISVAQKQGLRILIESHSTRSEAAGDDLDGPTLAKMFRAQARAVELLEKDPPPYIHYLIAETGGLLEPRRAPDLAAAARAAAALYARALRRHLQLDGEVEHGRARRHLREHRRQPRLGGRPRFKRAGVIKARVRHEIGVCPRFAWTMNAPALQQMKRDGKKIVGVVAWDYQIAQIADRAGVDIVSVGDTVGINLWGHPNPLEVTMDEMLVVAKAVRRGVKRALVSCDFPFGPLQESPEAAVRPRSGW